MFTIGLLKFMTAGAVLLRSVVTVSVLSILLSGCTGTNILQTAPFDIPSTRYASIVVDMSGKQLHAVRPDAIRFPAWVTKMMTLYLTFEALKAGKMSLSTQITISPKAARQPASKLYFKPGDTLTVDHAIKALVVKSANDVAMAVAEHLSGNETRFAVHMTARARSLGMSSTLFRNASGLPDKRQVSTARDMARLGIALRKRFPQYYHYFRKTSFVHNGRTVRGHNKVLGQLRGADGIKTGYTRASGFNLATSARTPRGRVVAVIMGENSSRTRNAHMIELIKTYGK